MLPVAKDLPAAPAAPAQDHAAAPSSGGQCADIRDAIIDALPFGLTLQDENGTYLLVNDAAAGHFGIAPRALADPRAPVPHGPGLSGAARAPQSATRDTLIERPDGRVLLTRQRSLRAAGRTLQLAASLDFTEHKAAKDELLRRAEFDELTGLPKRALAEGHIKALLRRDRDTAPLALVFMDIDNFKHINDYYGHATGDTLLFKLANRLKHELRDTDLLARIGGDEFLLVLSPIGRVSEVVDTVERLLQRLKAPFLIDGFEIFASASVGVSLYPDHGTTYEELRQNADTAMYRVKNGTKGEFALFEVTMEREAVARMELEQNLRLAILEKRFRCAFQPKVDLRTRAVVGVEALVRLYNENGFIQAPGEFIELATKLGLIDSLSHLVLENIMESIDLIDDRFGAGVSVSINVAATQASDRAFMASFADALAATGHPQRFMIEVTEDAFVRKNQFQAEILPMLRRIGVGLSIDDFGTGYSSLSALAEITADEIKIDQSFIKDVHRRPRSQAILRAIETLSEALGMTVIAEGVESHAELAYLQAATRIRFAQGYYFSHPQFLEQMEHPVAADGARTVAPLRQGWENCQVAGRTRGGR